MNDKEKPTQISWENLAGTKQKIKNHAIQNLGSERGVATICKDILRKVVRGELVDAKTGKNYFSK